MATALITGISGQDGSYLAELLLKKGYRVIGTARQRNTPNCDRIRDIANSIEIVETDLLDQSVVDRIVEDHRPIEIYNLAARASSSQLFEDPVLTGEINALAVARLLEAIRKVDPSIRFCQASSSEMFGNASESPQNEDTKFYPRNPYGVAKLCGHWFSVNYRETHKIFSCSSILFNHESPRRGTHFVTRKITQSVARIKVGLQGTLQLGDIEARRDWGYAADYVHAMWLMLQQAVADDYVLATGETHSVREFCEIAFGHVGLKYEDHVLQDHNSRRPTEVVQLVGKPSKAERLLGWRRSVSFRDLVCMMVDADMKVCSQES
jgi:GDPmannose 4,6-dehydratase